MNVCTQNTATMKCRPCGVIYHPLGTPVKTVHYLRSTNIFVVSHVPVCLVCPVVPCKNIITPVVMCPWEQGKAYCVVMQCCPCLLPLYLITSVLCVRSWYVDEWVDRVRCDLFSVAFRALYLVVFFSLACLICVKSEIILSFVQLLCISAVKLCVEGCVTIFYPI